MWRKQWERIRREPKEGKREKKRARDERPDRPHLNVL